ncbi:MAG: hypothetical protein KA419_21040 [Acidobacteria bacterium]|nr:hypothetical protein [Acidobacteriota bacterium]
MTKRLILVLTLFAGLTPGGFHVLAGTLEWECHGPLKGYSSTVTVSPVNPDVLYATAVEDGGATWAPAKTGMGDQTVNALLIQPTWTKTLYAATLAGVFRSSNGGQSWKPMNTGLWNVSVLSLAFHPKSFGTVYAGTSGAGVFQRTFLYDLNWDVVFNALDLVVAASLLGGNLEGADLDEDVADLDENGRFDAVDQVLMQLAQAEGD